MSVDTDGFAATRDDGVRAANNAPSAWRRFIAQYLGQQKARAGPAASTNSRAQPIVQCARSLEAPVDLAAPFARSAFSMTEMAAGASVAHGRGFPPQHSSFARPSPPFFRM